jgi:hypothetical protein
LDRQTYKSKKIAGDISDESCNKENKPLQFDESKLQLICAEFIS